MAHLLNASSISLDFGTGTVLDDISLGLDDGDRVGVVGDNGAGKSSLLKILAGRLDLHEGKVTRGRGVKIGVVGQSDNLPSDLTVAEAIVGDASDHEWASDPRIRNIMSGLVPDLAAHAPVAQLSGGQRRRIAIARELVGDHDIIFLDEPTNHLDVEGVAWLADHLRDRWAAGRGAVVVVTHDRWFLDAVCTSTWEVHDGSVDQYDGGYAAYVLERVERDRIVNATERKRQNLMRKELAWLRRGAPARTSKPKFRIDAANALIADVPPVRDKAALVRLAAARLGKEVVNLLGCSVTFGTGDDAMEVLRDVDWRIGPGERTGILGPNGAGKSTLLRLITGDLEPTGGRVKRGKTVRVATLSQHLDELAEHEDSRLRNVVKGYGATTLADGSEMSPGQLLERLGFTAAQVNTPVSKLSGGQRRRLQLLLVLLNEPNVIVLDEPTNDLDTDMLATIEDLLDAWPGALIVVSHDRYLLERVTDQQYAVLDGEFRHLPGGVEEYIALSRRRQAETGGIGSFGGQASATRAEAVWDAVEPSKRAGTSRERRRTRSGSEAGTAGVDVPRPPVLTGAERRVLEKEIGAIERRLAKVGDLIAELHQQMAEHDHDDYEGLAALDAERRARANEQDQLEERWLEATEALG